MRKLVIIGAGGLGSEVLWATRNLNERKVQFELCGFCDDTPAKKGRELGGLPVLGTIEEAAVRLGGAVAYQCAVGDNRIREALVTRAKRCGWQATMIVDPSVFVAPGVSIGEGTYVAALTVLSPRATIGSHVIINHGCSIGHDSKLGDFVQICPGGRISGGASIGRGAFVGSNAVVSPRGELGDHAVLGAASFATKKIPPGATAVGNPARVVFKAS